MTARINQQADVARALNALRKMVRGLRSSAEAVERDLGISAAQLFVLRELALIPGRSVKDLAEVTMTTHSTVSQVVGQLIAKQLVTRAADERDARRSVLRITRAGGELVRRAPRAIQEDLVDGFGLLASADRRSLAGGLEKWLAASGLAGEQSTMLFERPLLPGSRLRAARQKRQGGTSPTRRKGRK